MKRRHMRTYSVLKRYGFSALKSLEIVIDAQRGDEVALAFCRVAYRGIRVR